MNIKGFVLVLSITLSFCSAKATHFGSAEIFYRWVSDSTFEITLAFYRNCTGFAATAPLNVVVKAKSVNAGLTQNITLPMMATTGSGAPPLWPPDMFNCTDSAFCFEEYIYRGNFKPQKRATDWTFEYEFCCPVGNMTANFNDPLGGGFLYRSSGMNNLDFNSPVHRHISGYFHNRRPSVPGFLNDTLINFPYTSVCEGRPRLLNQSVRNLDGDRVEYEFFHPLKPSGDTLPYGGGYSFANPMPVIGPPPVLDSITGFLSFTAGKPTGNGLFLLGIKATEFRTDTFMVGGIPTVQERMIGHSKRHLFIMIEDSATCPDSIFAFSDTAVTWPDNSINIICDNNPLGISTTVRLECASIDSNASNMVLLNAATMDTVQLLAVYKPECNAEFYTRKFSVLLDSALAPGNYIFLFRTGDDGNTVLTECGSELLPFNDTLDIAVAAAAPIGYIIADTLLGSADTLVVDCPTSEFSILTTTRVLCPSIDPLGSEFKIFENASGKIAAVNKATFSCFPHTRKINLTLDSALINPAFHTVRLVYGIDGTTLEDECRRSYDTTSFVIDARQGTLDMGPDFEYCKGTDFDTLFSLPPKYKSYLWSTGSIVSFTWIFTAGTYWVQVVDSQGCHASDTMLVFEKICPGIEMNEAQHITVYPNPSHGLLTVDCSEDCADLTFRLYSLEGCLRGSTRILPGRNILDYTNLDNGVYFGEVLKDQEVQNRLKLILSK